jgi:hypothetical protein
MSSTIAECVPVIRLNNVDFPTFGLPTITTIDLIIVIIVSKRVKRNDKDLGYPAAYEQPVLYRI